MDIDEPRAGRAAGPGKSAASATRTPMPPRPPDWGSPAEIVIGGKRDGHPGVVGDAAFDPQPRSFGDLFDGHHRCGYGALGPKGKAAGRSAGSIDGGVD